MKVSYDTETDILYMIVKEGPIFDSKELDDDVRIEYRQRRADSGHRGAQFEK